MSPNLLRRPPDPPSYIPQTPKNHLYKLEFLWDTGVGAGLGTGHITGFHSQGVALHLSPTWTPIGETGCRLYRKGSRSSPLDLSTTHGDARPLSLTQLTVTPSSPTVVSRVTNGKDPGLSCSTRRTAGTGGPLTGGVDRDVGLTE